MNTFLKALLSKSHIIIVDNTNSQYWEYENYILATRLSPSYQLKIIELHCVDKKVCDRMNERNTHGVPNTSSQNMFKRWESHPEALLVEPHF